MPKKMPENLENFAFLRLSKEDWAVGWGQATWQAKPNPQGISFYAPDFFFETSTPWLIFEETRVWSVEEWRAFLKPVVEDARTFHFQQPVRDDFLRTMKDLHERIAEEELIKAVPVVFETLEQPKLPLPWMTWTKRALKLSEDLWAYGFWTKEEGMVGLTPEVLFRKKGFDVQTMALAGTRELSGPSLLTDAKELFEHQVVVDDIKAVLAPYGKVQQECIREKSLPWLKHLFTPIKVELENEISAEQLARAMHPTPALGGFPRQRAWDWLKAQPEASMRGRFGAPFGVQVEQDRAVMIVAIRSVLYEKGLLKIGSGCGVVEASDAEREWDELELKRDSVRKALGISG